MAYTYEHGGTIALTNGSTAVTGTGTSWTANYPGLLLVVDGQSYPVEAVGGRTSLTLVQPYPGPSATGVIYTLVPVQTENYRLAEDVQQIIDIAGDLVGKTVGPAGPVGPEGPRGPSGSTGFGAIVNLSDYVAQPAGASGIYLIAPVAAGTPPVTLSQSSTVYLPFNSTQSGIGVWINATVDRYALTLGLTNTPPPSGGGTGGGGNGIGVDEPLDLSGSSTVYGNPGTYVPLGIYLANSTASFTVDVPGGIPIKIEKVSQSTVPATARWVTGASGSPYPVTGDGVLGTTVLNKQGDGVFGYQNGHVVLNRGASLVSPALALEFPSTSNDATTQTPPSIKFSFKGKLGADGAIILANLEQYGAGGVRFGTHWSGGLEMVIGRNGGGEGVISDPATNRALGTNQLYEAEWIDNRGGQGGICRFYIDGVKVGADKLTEQKLRITPAAILEINASTGNAANSVDGMEVEYLELTYGRIINVSSYTAVSDGPISKADLESLVVDARAYGASETEHHLTYTANGTQTFDLTIIIGDPVLPAGRAYKAVLEDWSSGAAVAHPNELVMTKVAAQNCRFEDTTLFSKQASWTECLPKGPVPILDGISYYCEAIRMGTYVQFQFAYDWSEDYVPSAPFGNPQNLETYMRPHKWAIYDSAGTLLARIAKPNGNPLNGTDTKPCWEGSFDGRSVPQITAANPHYPHGTVRSSVIWRSHDPVAYSQAEIYDMVPTYDMRTPYASHINASTNGFDLRIGAGGAGGDGQMNGFANYRSMSWEPTNYNDIITAGANTQSPYKKLYEPVAITPNAGVWLKYTPFNIQGRSPITGPGGTRDDRQIMPEPVALYARDVTATRLHDARPLRDIALHYLTGYASDAIHGIENGRNVPLYKGNARRSITARNHYYGPGEATTPEAQAWYQQGGRLSEWVANTNPLRPRIPYGAKTAGKPYFGTFQSDRLHAHQFPHWGSMLFQTPEFAFLGHRFWDQDRLYDNHIIDNGYGPSELSDRTGAWMFMQTALAWKTASANSQRLYSRAEVMDFAVYDFEQFYDRWYDNGGDCFLNPPTNLLTNGEFDGVKAMLAGFSRFGITGSGAEGAFTHDFSIGYWLSALHAAEKTGFNAALRAASAKAAAVLNFIITAHHKRIVGRINDATLMPAMNDTEYLTMIWSKEQVEAAGGNVAALPQNWAAVQAAVPANKRSASWDSFKASDGTTTSRDGQAMDQLLAGPALLQDMGRSDAALTSAATTAEARFQEKKTAEEAKGGLAGTEWFKWHQTTNNRPYKP